MRHAVQLTGVFASTRVVYAVIGFEDQLRMVGSDGTGEIDAQTGDIDAQTGDIDAQIGKSVHDRLNDVILHVSSPALATPTGSDRNPVTFDCLWTVGAGP